MAKERGKDELSSALAARRELGPEYEDPIVDAFLAKIERRLDERTAQDDRALRRRREHQKEMILGAMGISIPLFAIAAVFGGLAGMLVVAATLAVIALAVSRST